MKRYAKITPEGTRDLLFEECAALNTVENKLTGMFRGLGYHEVQTPGIEFYDVLLNGNAGFPEETLFKLCDNKGRLIVVRPDSTLPIARMASTRLQNTQLPVRLFYNQKVYRNHNTFSGHSNEVAQIGVEMIGADGKRADLEILTTACYALEACMSDFRLELGHAEIFKAIVREMNLSEDAAEEIRSYIENKNYAALDVLLDEMEDSKAVRAMRRLPRLFGGEEVLREAEELCGDAIATESLAYLESLYRELSALGLGNRLIIDLGQVHQSNYYTGIVFRGYLEGSGETVLSGGRYDNLLERYGMSAPAVGFGVDAEEIMRLMLRLGTYERPQSPNMLIFSESGYEIKGLQYLKRQLDYGNVCESATCETREEAFAYAKTRKIPKLVVVGEYPVEER